jgi:hypothetical protein
MSFSDIEHFGTMIDGCEALQSGDRKSESARYAFSVLRIQQPDMASVAGQESFTSTIVNAGKHLYEMIKNFIRSIRDFFFGSKGAKQEVAVKKAEADLKDKNKEIKEALKKNNSDGMGDSPLANDIRKAVSSAEALNKVLSGDGVIISFESIIDNKKLDHVTLFDMIHNSHDLGVGLSPDDYKLYQVQKEIQEFINKFKHESGITDRSPNSVIITSSYNAELAGAQLGEIFRLARKGLEQVNKDLEKVNNQFKRHETGNNEKGMAMARTVLIALSKVGSRLTDLIRLCLNTLGELEKKMNSIMSSLELDTNKDAANELMDAFDTTRKFAL